MKLTVVIPVYNERQFIAEILHRVQHTHIERVEKEVIIIDDCSSDGTREFLEEIVNTQTNPQARKSKRLETAERFNIDNIKVLFHHKNQGKGAALRRGFKEVTGDVVVIQDADLEYDPSDYPKLLAPIKQGVADVVYGSRFLGGPHRVLYFWHYVGNRFLTTLSNIFSNLNLTDMETCYKVFRRQLLDGMEIKQNRFGFEPEFTAKLARKGCRIYEVPIAYYGRTYAEGKKSGWKDGLVAIYCIVRYNLFS